MSFEKSVIQKYQGIIIACLFLLALIIRVFFLFNYDNYFFGDATARLYYSRDWSINPVWFPSPDWLPLHFWALGSIIKFTGDYWLAPRLFGVLVGSLTVIPLYALTKRLFSIPIALLTSVIFCLHAPHILGSILTLSTVPFIFFVVMGINSLSRFLEQEKSSDLVWAGLSLSCASLLRFEGWIFMGLFFLIVVFKRKSFKSLFVFCLISGATVIWTMYMTWQMTGDPLWGINFSDYEVRRFFDLTDINFNISVPLNAYPPTIFIFGIIGILLCLHQKRNYPYLFIVLIASGIVFFKVFTGSLVGEFRYFVTSSILFLPIAIYGLAEIVQLLFKKIKKPEIRKKLQWTMAALIVIISGLLSHRCVFEEYCYTLPGRFDEGFHESSVWAKKNIKQPRIFLDQSNWLSNAWAVYSDNDIWHHTDSTLEGIVCHISGRYWLDEIFTEDYFCNCLNNENISHLVLFREGEMAAFLHFDQQEERAYNFKFDRVFSSNGYMIYKVQKINDLQCVPVGKTPDERKTKSMSF